MRTIEPGLAWGAALRHCGLSDEEVAHVLGTTPDDVRAALSGYEASRIKEDLICEADEAALHEALGKMELRQDR